MPSGLRDHTVSNETGLDLVRETLLAARGDEVGGYAISFVAHAAILATLAAAVIPTSISRPPQGVTIRTEADPHEVDVDYELTDVQIIEPAGREDPILRVATITLPQTGALDSLPPTLSTAAAPGGAGGQQGEIGEPQPRGGAFGVPENAVEAGSFVAWWVPKVERFGEQVAPGQLPRVGQDYRIFVQIRVPEERESFRVDDLSGEIVGSDGYRQPIPDRAWIPDDKGGLESASRRRLLKVRDGLVRIVFKVEAAGKAGVKDTIRIRSKLLGEEQLLTLQFEPVE